ncbi:MAG: DUF687 family protein [Verrucomicrobia bacterium]|nr:DUF687 family protein [Verrucomicrobiota bacterium]
MKRFFLICFLFSSLCASSLQLVSTESDPDAFVQNSVNVINGDYCESATDLVITGPDALVLQRFYSAKSPVAEWRIFPQRFLVLGKDASRKTCTVGKDRFAWAFAFVGERSGGILPYSGWRNTNGTTKDPLKIDVLNNASGMVNTYAGEINGQTNHQNNLLHCKGKTCQLILGDGTKRIYQKVPYLPSLLLGEELTPWMASQMIEPDYFLLSQEILPSGSQLFFSYDAAGHLIEVEMKNTTSTKTFSWIRLAYEFQDTNCRVDIETSDDRRFTYHFALDNGMYHLVQVEGSHCMPVSYEYRGVLVKKTLPEGRFVEVDYQEGKVKSLKGPSAQLGKAEIVHAFSYGDGYTDAFDAMSVKTRYVYDKRFQLTAIERYDDRNELYRIEQKFWGKTQSDAGFLLAKTIGDATGCVHSYHSFQYDQSGNVTEERLYGNLTGKEQVSLQISSDGKLLNPDEGECNIKTFTYSTDGFNSLTEMGDCKGDPIIYIYKPGTNLLVKKLVRYKNGGGKKRTFQFYNDDGVCVKIIEDDGCHEEESKIYNWYVTERHIKEIKPKENLPGVGLPEIIEEKSIDLRNRREVLIKKIINTYDNQSKLLSCSTYDANDAYAFTESRVYNALGQVVSQVDANGREVNMTYDGIGNQIATSVPQDGKHITSIFDFHNQPVEITEITAEGQFSITNTYDSLGRKVCFTDRFGNSTYYEYDAFHRLIKVVHPEVLDQNNQIIHPTFRYTYDIFGNVLTIEDPKGDVVTKSYNLRGDPTKINYPDGSFELFKYNPEGNLHRSLTRDQIATVYTYDDLGRPICEENSIVDKTGVFSCFKRRSLDYNGFRCTHEYEKGDCVRCYSFDPAGRLAALAENEWEDEDDPEARLTEIFYDPLGRLHQRRVWFDSGPQDYSLECFEYDLSGHVVEKRIEDAQGVVLLKKCFSYDSQGHCIEEYILANETKISSTRTFYNSEGEPVGYLDGLGRETKIIIDNSYQNNLGQTVLKKTLINPIGVQTEIEFDALSRVCAIAKKDPFGVLLSYQKIFYDPSGNKSCEIHDRIRDGKILGTYKTQWIYGPMGRLEEEVEAADSPLEKRTVFQYNSFGKVIGKSIAGVATPINYTYTNEGKLHKIEAQDSNKKLQISNSYSWDYDGNILSADSLHGPSIRRTYNAFHQVLKEIVQDGEGSYTLQYAYDKKGRLKEIVLPDQSVISYIYGAVFCREIKRISARGEVLYTHAYDRYDSQGKLQHEVCIGHAGAQEHTYNMSGEKIARKNDFFSEQYIRDALGRLLEVKGDKNEEYNYNTLSQLTSEKIHSKTYAYDSLDNRVRAAGNDCLLCNALNQLISYSNAEFSYDPSGNLLKKVLDGEETRFKSNALAQLVSMETPDKTTLTFSYDAFGRLLVEKHIDKNEKTLSTTRYFYLGHQEIGALTEAGTIETLKIPGSHGVELAATSIAFEIKGATYVPLHDIAGNVVSLIDPQSRQLVESYEYTAFGEEIICNSCGEIEDFSVVGNPWRFAEKRVNQEAGLILFGLRFYDPTAGRWVNQDPAGFIDGPNLYAYLHNNPLNHLDRLGCVTEENTENKFEEYFYREVKSHGYCHPNCRCNCSNGGSSDIGKAASSGLPKITYNDYFEKFYKDYRNADLFIKNFYENSTYYDLSGDSIPNLSSDLGIGFINGIWNDFEGARASTQYLSKLAGGYNIHAVYNATHGRGVDVYECELGLKYIATEPVRQLHKIWNSFFELSSAGAKFLMICHSQGAIHVRNALLDYPPELRERILVVAIAPAAYIYQETCAQVIHYRAEGWRDFVPRLDRAGAKREKDTIVTLASHPDAAAFDHAFMSPTYQKLLKQQIINYIIKDGRML